MTALEKLRENVEKTPDHGGDEITPGLHALTVADARALLEEIEKWKREYETAQRGLDGAVKERAEWKAEIETLKDKLKVERSEVEEFTSRWEGELAEVERLKAESERQREILGTWNKASVNERDRAQADATRYKERAEKLAESVNATLKTSHRLVEQRDRARGMWEKLKARAEAGQSETSVSSLRPSWRLTATTIAEIEKAGEG